MNKLLLPVLVTLACGCGNKKPDGAELASSGAASSLRSASSAAHSTSAGSSPLHVVLESKAALAFAGVAGGVWMGSMAAGRTAQALGAAELESVPIPEGLAPEPAHFVGAYGRLPHSLWISLELEAKGDKNHAVTPLYRVDAKGKLQRIAEDWRPLLSTWSKNRILAMSTSSSRLKVKVVEPHMKDPPPDLPGPKLDDASCAKDLKLFGLAALPSSQVFAAGLCTVSGSASPRYVIIRWAPEARSSAPDQTVTKPQPSASASTTGTAAAAGPDPTDAGTETHDDGLTPGTVFALPGTAGRLSHCSLWANAANDVLAVATDSSAKKGPLARLFHFNGKEWAIVEPPLDQDPAQSAAETTDGAIWLGTAHSLWMRLLAGDWLKIDLPTDRYPDATWELLDVFTQGSDDVWVHARVTAKASTLDVVLRTKAARELVRW